MSASANDDGTPAAERTWCLTCRALYRATYARCPADGGELVPAVEDPLVGTTLAGRYVIERVLGEGGLGHVYAARHTRMSRRYAIKVPYGELTHDPVARARFLREADVVGRLEHPAVVAATDVGETAEGLLYLAMDLAEGFSLDVVLEAGAMPGHRIPILLDQLLAGLAHAHERGIVHRDLKPANVIVDRDRARIVDFGIAALVEDGAGGRTRLTTEGTIIGTPHYMAPEQLSARPVDARTDLFSLGVMLYEMLSGKLPFDGGPMEIAAQNLAGDPPRIATRAPEAGAVDPLIEALARWLMEKDAAARPQRADDALAVLRMMRDDRAAAARALAPWLEPERAAAADARDSRETTRISERVASRRSRAVTFGLALVPVALLVIWWAQTRTDQPQPRAQPQPPAVTPEPLAVAPPPPAVTPEPPAVTPEPPAVTRPPPAVTRRPPAVTRRPPPVTPPPPPPPSPSSDSFHARYTTVGEALAAFRKSRGDDAAADLLRRYRAIAYLDAVRKPDLRAAAIRELDAIARALSSRP